MAPVKAEEDTDMYTGMRKMTLELTAKDLELPRTQDILALMMEMGTEQGVATLVAVADGSTSLYYSNGGGIIGAGEHDGPKKAALELLETVKQYKADMHYTTSFPLPKLERTVFYLVTSKGVLTAEFAEESLGNNEEKLSPLFFSAQHVISEIFKIAKVKE